MSGAPPTYPVSTIAKLLLLTPRRVQQLASEGHLPKTGRGKYELAPTVQAYIRYLQDRTPGNATQPGAEDLGLHRVRKAKADADLAEMEVAKRRNELVPIEDSARVWQGIASEIRAKMLGQVPDRIGKACFGCETEGEMRRAALAEIEAALTALAATDPATIIDVEAAE